MKIITPLVDPRIPLNVSEIGHSSVFVTFPQLRHNLAYLQNPGGNVIAGGRGEEGQQSYCSRSGSHIVFAFFSQPL